MMFASGGGVYRVMGSVSLSVVLCTSSQSRQSPGPLHCISDQCCFCWACEFRWTAVSFYSLTCLKLLHNLSPGTFSLEPQLCTSLSQKQCKLIKEWAYVTNTIFFFSIKARSCKNEEIDKNKIKLDSQ